MNIGDIVTIVENDPDGKGVGDTGKCVGRTSTLPTAVYVVETFHNGARLYLYESETRPATDVEILAAKLR